MNILGNLGQDLVDFYYSGFFMVIKIILGIYALVIIADMIFIVILRGFGKDYRVTRTGFNVPPKKVAAKRWQKIKGRLKKEDMSQYKIAILEADKMVDEMMDRIGHRGENMPHRMSQLKPGQIENSEDLIKAHQVRNDIIHEKELLISREKAQEIIEIYENFLQHFELI